MLPKVCKCAHPDEFHVDEEYAQGCTAIMGFKMDKKGLYEAVYCNCRKFSLWTEDEEEDVVSGKD